MWIGAPRDGDQASPVLHALCARLAQPRRTGSAGIGPGARRGVRAPEVGVAVVLTCSGSPVQSSAVLLTRTRLFRGFVLYCVTV